MSYMKAPSQHIPTDPRRGEAWNRGWNGQSNDYSDPQLRADYERGLAEGRASDAFVNQCMKDSGYYDR